VIKKSKAVQKRPMRIVAEEYVSTLADLKRQVQEAQIKAALSVNRELIKLYWQIGRIIYEKQEKSDWGSFLIERIANDLQNEFTGIAGFSRANIFNMRAFYAAYAKVQQVVGLFEEQPLFSIPWGHNVILVTRLKETEQRLWYAQKTIENGWSRSALESWIKADLYNREGKAISNFKHTLPSPHSDIAHQTLKDPYIFDFLTLHDDHVEKDLEMGLVNNVQKLLLELGKGFAFMGRQYHLEVSGKDFYIDLLFYHIKLRCFVVVELKTQEFDPRDAGQLNFYLSVVDEQLRHPDDKPTIGLLLCKTKDNLIAEYSLRNINKPIGVADYETEIIKRLPKELKSSLPSVEEIEVELKKQHAMAHV
jgi:predicted nuclease of restriction endonuclease-like (RecB) superfamily